MASNTAWRGAVELAGFPVHVALYSRVKGQRTTSFKTLSPTSKKPIRSAYLDPESGDEVARADCLKGVEIEKDIYQPLPPETIEAINAGVKTQLAKLEQLCPVGSIAWDLAIDRFAVCPDSKVPGSEQSLNILWNGLRDSALAYTTQVSLRGGHDAILAIYADDVGLLPFEVELYEVPTPGFTEDEDQAAMFASFIENQYADQIGDFDHSHYESEYRARREYAIEAALAGEAIKVEAPKPASAVPDLMAVMAAATKKPAKKPAAKTTKKVAA
jgi:DNA end-binding protein Ku